MTFAANSIFEVEIIGSGNTPGVHNDLLAVGGVATLEGGTVQVVTLDPEASYQEWQAYTILTAGDGVTGEFLEAVSDSAFITTELTHNTDNVILGLGLINSPEPEPEPEHEPKPEPGLFPTAAHTYNQTQAGIGLDDLDQISGSDALAVYNQILMLSEDKAQRAFDLTSGEIHASGQHVIDQTVSLFGRTLRQQGTAGLGGSANGQVMAAPLACSTRTETTESAARNEVAACADAHVANAWLAPLGGRGTIDGDGNAAELDWWNAGIAGGYEGNLDVASDMLRTMSPPSETSSLAASIGPPKPITGPIRWVFPARSPMALLLAAPRPSRRSSHSMPAGPVMEALPRPAPVRSTSPGVRKAGDGSIPASGSRFSTAYSPTPARSYCVAARSGSTPLPT